jgi:NAD(P)-dependent dehydrogenase (short-subunit alcohol dehydrogenase family)
MLNNSVVVVTGGAGLLGRTFCAEIARSGGIAIVADVNLQAAETAASGICKDHPGRAHAAALDITDAASIEALIASLHAQHGRIDAVVNNAYPRNANYGRKLEEVEYSDFCTNVSLHLGGYFLVSKCFGLHFKKQGHGNIVNMSSIYGVIAPRFDVYEGTTMTMPVEYAAIKSGVVHLTRYFAQYFKADGIRVNTLSPGGILDRQPESFVTRYNAMAGTKGMLSPSDILGALVFLLSDGSRYMTGQNLVVDDGFSI